MGGAMHFVGRGIPIEGTGFPVGVGIEIGDFVETAVSIVDRDIVYPISNLYF